MRYGGYLAAIGAPILATTLGCGNSSGEGPADGSTDATTDVVVPESDTGVDSVADAGAQQAADGEAGCSPQSFDSGRAFVPPNPPTSVCTTAQIQAFYNACFSGGTAANCNAFTGDPANSTCIRCMVSYATAPSWGPVIYFSDNDVYLTNVGGCITWIDQDASPGACGPAIQALKQCEHYTCAAGCPKGNTPEGYSAFAQCQGQADTTICAQFFQPAECGLAPTYNRCIFVNFQSSFEGLGQFFCASTADAGPDSAAGADTGAGPDAGSDALQGSDASIDSAHE